MTQNSKFKLPNKGVKIGVEGNKLIVGDNPIIPFITGDGVGPEIWKASKAVFDNAVKKAYNNKKQIAWMEIYAGENAAKLFGRNKPLPTETIKAIKEYTVAIKGPLNISESDNVKSPNMLLRQQLDLFAYIRPVRYFTGITSPVKRPQDIDVFIIRENTESIYLGDEFKAKRKATAELINYLNNEQRQNIPNDASLAVNAVTEFGTMRFVKKAIEFAIEQNRSSVTVVHTGDVLKHTEGSFKEWSYKAAKKFFPGIVISEEDLRKKYKGSVPKGKILIRDLNSDVVIGRLLTNPGEFDVIVASGLNSDLIANACSAHVGGLGMSPGANFSYSIAVFEAAHGTVPKYAGKDKVNPSAFILSGAMMLNYIGWNKAASLIERALKRTIKSKVVTYDLARLMKGAKTVKCSQFAKQVIKNMN